MQWGATTKVPDGKQYLQHIPQQSVLAQHVLNVKDGKKFIPRKGLNVMTTKKQWNAIEVPNQSKSNTNDDETYKKIAIKLKEVRVI